MNIVMWLKLEFESKRLSGPFIDFNVKPVRCPQQLNTDDCGVFILAYADLLSNKLDLDIMTQSLADGAVLCYCFLLRRVTPFTYSRSLPWPPPLPAGDNCNKENVMILNNFLS